MPTKEAAAFTSLFSNVRGALIGISRFRDKAYKGTEVFDSEKSEEAYEHAMRHNSTGEDVFFCIKAFSGTPSGLRGKAEDPGYITCVSADLDYGSDAHKSKDNPPTQEAALSLLSEFSLQPSIVNHSGYGLHLYWLLKEPIDATTEEGWNVAWELIQGVQDTLIKIAGAHGWHMDRTADLVRLMRVPGSINHKEGKKVKGRILNFNPELRYSVEELRDACPPEVIQAIKAQKITVKTTAKTADDHGVIPFGRRNTKLTSLAGSMRNQGMTGASILAALQVENEERCEEPLPENEVEAIARSVAKYDPQESIKDLVIAAEDDIQKLLPQIALASSKVFEAETIGALAVLSLYDQTVFTKMKTRIKEVCRTRISETELKMALRVEIGKLRAARQEEKEPTEDLFPGLGYQLVVPKGYRMDHRGVAKFNPDGVVPTFPCPVVISRRFRNPQTCMEMVEIAYVRDGSVYYATAERSVVFSRHKIMELADWGLPVTSESAKELVIFLSELEQQNVIPRVACSASLGWVDDNAFLPYDTAAAFLDKRGFDQLAGAYVQKGTLPGWIELTKPVRASLPGRLMLSAAYASPLVSIVGTRTSGIMAWGLSQAGKTAGLKASASIYGHPEKSMISMLATKVAIEQTAGFLRNLPLCIDERQMAESVQALDNLVYTISGGEGKSRGQKNGGVRARGHWETLAIITGEHPISSESSAAGVRGRLLEINITKVVDNEVGSKLHRGLTRQHGTAGPVYIEHLKSIRPEIRHRFDEWLDKARKAFPEISGSHVSLLALLGLADEIASVAIHGEEQCAAEKAAWAFIQELSRSVITTADMDDAEKAKNHVLSMYLENRRRFENFGEHEFGEMEGEELKIVPSVLNRFLRDGGYNPQRARADFIRMGWMRTFETRSGERVDKRFERSSQGQGGYNGYYNYLAFPELVNPQRDKRTVVPATIEPAWEGGGVSPESLI